jgi:hypothetical protein
MYEVCGYIFSARPLQQVYNDLTSPQMKGTGASCVQTKHQSTVAQQSKSGSCICTIWILNLVDLECRNFTQNILRCPISNIPFFVWLVQSMIGGDILRFCVFLFVWNEADVNNKWNATSTMHVPYLDQYLVISKCKRYCSELGEMSKALGERINQSIY